MATDTLKTPADMTDAELNSAVAREVMGWRSGIAEDRWSNNAPPHYSSGYVKRTADGEWEPWSPATGIAAAMNDVVGEMMRRGYWFEFRSPAPGTSYGENWLVSVLHLAKPRDPDSWFKAKHPMLARAICEAALKAKREDRGG